MHYWLTSLYFYNLKLDTSCKCQFWLLGWYFVELGTINQTKMCGNIQFNDILLISGSCSLDHNCNWLYACRLLVHSCLSCVIVVLCWWLSVLKYFYVSLHLFLVLYFINIVLQKYIAKVNFHMIFIVNFNLCYLYNFCGLQS